MRFTFTGSIVAFGKLNGKFSSKPLQLPFKAHAQPGRAGGVVYLAADFCGRTRQLVCADCDDRHRAGFRLALGGFHRRCRYAGGGVDAQLLLRLGSCRRRLYARQRFADRHRRIGRLQRRDPFLYHV